MPNHYDWVSKGVRKLYWRYKKQAADRGYEFELSKDLFTSLVLSPKCFYCLRDAYQITYDTTVLGIDRKDNSVGYKESNCVPCCKECNYAKGKMSFRDFISKFNLWPKD
jgi:5-methylcytosine-specific restriction endonuclease McrA